MLIAVLLALETATLADDREKAAALIDRAATASRLSQLKDPYVVKLSFRVPGEHGTEGTYQFWSFEKWRSRTEVHARGYDRIEVGFPDHRAIASDLPYTPDPIQTLFELVANGTAFQWPIPAGGVKVKKQDGDECVLMKRGKNDELRLCFDPSTSLLRSVTDSAGQHFEYLNYAMNNGRQVAREMNAWQQGYLVVAAKLEALTTPQSVDPALMQPPPNAENWDWCENMQPAKLIRATRPVMPRGFRFGFSRFWMVVGTDGRVEQGGVMETGGPALDRASAAAMKDWLFRPAMCQGIPVRVKTTASFTFQ